MSLNRGCEERPSRRKEGWEVGAEGAGAGAGPPGQRKQQHSEVSGLNDHNLCLLLLNRSRQGMDTSHWVQHHRLILWFLSRRATRRESYYLMRGRPAGQAALLQLKQAWWAPWSGLPAPHHYRQGGLINR